MDRETTLQLMGEQLEVVRSSELSRVCRWVIELDDLYAFFSMRPRLAPDHLFLLRVWFDEFPRRAPSYVFVDRESRRLSESAWPPGVRHSADPEGICTIGTRECHEHYHKNDRKYVWSDDERCVLQTVAEIQRMMELKFK